MSAAVWLRSDALPPPRILAGSSTKNGTTAVEPIGLPAPDLLRPLTAEQAVMANAEKSIALRSDTPAARFVAQGDAMSKMRALDCLAQAVYYEAASEGVDGGRAVAQIVLNRVRHPGYPNAVCNVVYQGSVRSTGCQFTFTCDGSLRRVPLSYLWTRARLIAREALAGRVFSPVGHATHYHADYVVPYWADSLDKVAVIGRHIFYRIRGAGGASGVFTQRYSGAESSPPLPPSAEVIEQGLDAVASEPPAAFVTPLPRVAEDRLNALGTGTTFETKALAPLQADLSRGRLILGESDPGVKMRKQDDVTCPGGGSRKIEASRSDNLTAVSDKQRC